MKPYIQVAAFCPSFPPFPLHFVFPQHYVPTECEPHGAGSGFDLTFEQSPAQAESWLWPPALTAVQIAVKIAITVWILSGVSSMSLISYPVCKSSNYVLKRACCVTLGKSFHFSEFSRL